METITVPRLTAIQTSPARRQSGRTTRPGKAGPKAIRRKNTEPTTEEIAVVEAPRKSGRRLPSLIALASLAIFISTLYLGTKFFPGSPTAFGNLEAAVLAGDAQAVEGFLDAGASPDRRSKDGRPVLCIAAGRAYYDVYDLLLRRGARPSERDGEGATIVHHVAALGKLRFLQRLDQVDVALDTKDFQGRTALHRAAQSGAVEAIPFLLDRGLSLEERDLADRTPLMLAAAAGELESLDLLLRKGANEEAQDLTAGARALLLAAQSGNLTVVERLVEGGAALRIFDQFGRGLVSYAAAGGNPAIVTYFLERGSSLERVDDEGFTPLHLAASAQVASVLLEAGLAMERKTRRGLTALHYQAFQGRRDVVECLLETGAILEADEASRRRPSAWASWGGHPSLAAFLEEHERQAVLSSRGQE
jgi:ankyrin repeat protein